MKNKIKKKGRKAFRPDSNDVGLICNAARNMHGYKRNAWYNLSCRLQTYCHWSTNEKLSVSWQFSETYVVTSYSSGWRKDAVNQCLVFGSPVYDQTHRFNLLYISLCIKGDKWTQQARPPGLSPHQPCRRHCHEVSRLGLHFFSPVAVFVLNVLGKVWDNHTGVCLRYARPSPRWK